VPDNYYADLQARFGLDDDRLSELSELDLLYDRDGAGEFVHFYTRTFGNVFFEVVERRRAYDGYGAPNAPVRLASQHSSPKMIMR
jgi:4-hydroxyphenylpyruvate dioxygenase